MELSQKEKEYLERLLERDISATKRAIVENADANEHLEHGRKYKLLYDVQYATSIKAKLGL